MQMKKKKKKKECFWNVIAANPAQMRRCGDEGVGSCSFQSRLTGHCALKTLMFL